MDGFILSVEELLNELKRQEEESDDNISDYDPEETCSETDDVLLLNQVDLEEISDAEDIEKHAGLSRTKDNKKDPQERGFELGKDLETVWTDKPLETKVEKNTEKHLNHLMGPKGEAKGILEETALFDLLINNQMIEAIVTFTNKEMENISMRQERKQYYTSPTDTLEIKALIGLLCISAIFKKSGLNSSDLFSPIYGPPIFRSAMTRNRFDLLLRVLRFDDRDTREARKSKDKFAAFREMWIHFQENCQKYYTPSEHLTVDRTLLSFRGKCPFKTCVSVKGDKCGFKIISMCDAMTYYYLGGVPCVEKVKKKPSEYVLELARPFIGSNRNITCDSWFSSFELVDELKKNGLTMVGSIRKNKPQIPPSMLEENSIRFLYHPDKMIVSYAPQGKKHELLISSKHFTNEINRDTSKPKIVEYYNSTKGGVDVLNKLCRDKTTRRRTRRWTMRYFFSILDIAIVNSFILHKWNSGNYDYSNKSRTNFFKHLSFGLAEPLMKRRSINGHLPKELRATVGEVLGGYPEETKESKKTPGTKKRRRCDFCDSSKDRKGNQWCFICDKILCGEHKVVVCPPCSRTRFETED